MQRRCRPPLLHKSICKQSATEAKVVKARGPRTKIRRVDPLPAFDQTTPSRTIVAINIPAESATIELVAEMFKPCGEIALIRLLRPGKINYIFKALAFKTMSTWCQDAKDFIKEVGTKLVNMTGD
ncbi:hypothetical protein WDU94_000052 [Cyamophila willieti]